MKRLITRLHLWIGLVLGIQVLLWMASGVIMSWVHIDTVRGTDRQLRPETITLDRLAAPLAPKAILTQFPAGTVKSLELISFLGEPAWAVSLTDGRRLLHDAQTGKRMSPLSRGAALMIAEADYSGTATVRELEWLESTPGTSEYRGSFPVWRATFSDTRETRLYISPDDGRVAARRNSWWRLYDFFWMLHIMDYETRDNFNSWLIRAAAALGLLFASTGLGLVFLRLAGGRYGNDVRLMFKRRRG